MSVSSLEKFWEIFVWSQSVYKNNIGMQQGDITYIQMRSNAYNKVQVGSQQYSPLHACTSARTIANVTGKLIPSSVVNIGHS